MQPDHVHAALGQESRVVCQIVGTAVALDISRQAPKASRRAVTQDEALAVGREPHEPALAGDLLVQRAQVKERVAAKRVALGKKPPDVADVRRSGLGIAGRREHGPERK